jgi:hypothetical protein
MPNDGFQSAMVEMDRFPQSLESEETDLIEIHPMSLLIDGEK